MANYKNLVLDARPDRLDLRDREYRPRLKSLANQFPSQSQIESFLPCYTKNGLILNQGKEGACTGFGLAATINYLLWRDKMDSFGESNDPNACSLEISKLLVSERMLYHMAKIYDEWPGEDYSGSSCRGAMKGWHRHGVCKKSLWEYDVNGVFLPPKDDTWAVDALNMPLGAYYRINHASVVDMQSAIAEVGAIYCSSSVHKGWRIGKKSSLPVLTPKYESKDIIGGHAFCIIGYTQDGFLVQNSWGESWGWHGFAILCYEDWVVHGNDAWVVSRGMPVRAERAPIMFSNNTLQDISNNKSDPSQALFNKAKKYKYPQNFKALPWSADKAYQHSLVISNNGRPKHTSISGENADATASQICYTNVKKWLTESSKNRKIVIYAHGGLNSEEASINRVRIMAPYFLANGIYPIFLVWKTGLGETLNNLIKDAFTKIHSSSTESGERAEGIGEWITDRTDTAIEVMARSIHAKSIWSEMKENAAFASDRAVAGFAQNKAGKKGANVLLAAALQKLQKEFSNIELHIAGHSAGAIVLGAWLKELIKRKTLHVKTASLYAPACTLQFANKTYKVAIEAGILKKKDLYIHMMDDEMEKADNTGKVYRKSLLYLVSRALEDLHKMPLLGMQAAWNINNYSRTESGGFTDVQKSEAIEWIDFMKGGNANKIYGRKHSRVKIYLEHGYIDLSHGSFDNDIAVITHTLTTIKGNKLDVAVHNLYGY